jgi:hypothetical protein
MEEKDLRALATELAKSIKTRGWTGSIIRTIYHRNFPFRLSRIAVNFFNALQLCAP